MYSSKAIYIFIRLDCLAVEVERLHRPELRKRAVIIGGRPEQRGSVLACSGEAQRLGVSPGMPMVHAYRLAPQACFLHDRLYGNYRQYSQKVAALLAEHVPLLTSPALGEFLLDLSGCESWLSYRYGGVMAFVSGLQRQVKEDIGLALSAGIAANRSAAELACASLPPCGIRQVPFTETAGFLAPLPVSAIPHISPATARSLQDLGINRIGQLLHLRNEQIKAVQEKEILGLVQVLRGEAESPELPTSRRRKGSTVRQSVVLVRDEVDPEQLERRVWGLVEEACRELRERFLAARQLQLRVLYSDRQTSSRIAVLSPPTTCDRRIYAEALKLLEAAHYRRQRVRELSLSLGRCITGVAHPGLFAERRDWAESDLYSALDRIRARYGHDIVVTGAGVMNLAKRAEVHPLARERPTCI